MGGLQSKQGKSDHPSSTVHLRDKKDLAGVGIIFRKGPDGSLIVKELIDGSCAEECKQIQSGDTLTQVDDVRISKVSIAEVSGMILGEPGQPVRLKFTRSVGRSKRKYKVVLKRTVRATLEPTYRVQRDGINTRVTHIHLDCMQNRDTPAAESPPEVARVRDVLDANGNVVGPGLLEKARTMAATREQDVSPPIPGVERIDASHPAWPGKKTRSKGELSGKGGQLPRLKPAQTTGELVDAKPNPEFSEEDTSLVNHGTQPNASALHAVEEDFLLQSSTTYAEPDFKDDGTNILDAFGLGQPKDVAPPHDSPVNYVDPASLYSVTVPTPPEEEEEVKEEEKFVPVAVPAPQSEEEAKSSGGLDWEGLAESRIAVFEAKRKELEPSRNVVTKQVDLEKEWARTAQAAQVNLKDKKDTPPQSEAPAIKSVASTERKEWRSDKASGPVSGGSNEVKKAAVSEAVAASSTGTPKKFGGQSGGKGGDLAALMAARKKKMEDEDEDGYYF